MNDNNCYVCGAEYRPVGGRWQCPACDAYKPEQVSEEKSTLLHGAAQKLRLLDFAGAEDRYTDIISRFPSDPEGYWGRLRAKFGIKYERDYDGRYLPTCYASLESILKDKDYLKVLELCSGDDREIYKKQAQQIEGIRCVWMEKVKKEEPYDIFLSFKDSDRENGIKRTEDRSRAEELYFRLTEKGYRVFFSPVTLRGKLGEEYEPYIFNALRTAGVMVLYGSQAEYFHSPWIRNEWTRFMKQMKEGKKADGSLILALDGVEPEDLPRELRSRQFIDASSMSFLTDLLTRVSELLGKKKSNATSAGDELRRRQESLKQAAEKDAPHSRDNRSRIVKEQIGEASSFLRIANTNRSQGEFPTARVYYERALEKGFDPRALEGIVYCDINARSGDPIELMTGIHSLSDVKPLFRLIKEHSSGKELLKRLLKAVEDNLTVRVTGDLSSQLSAALGELRQKADVIAAVRSVPLRRVLSVFDGLLALVSENERLILVPYLYRGGTRVKELGEFAKAKEYLSLLVSLDPYEYKYHLAHLEAKLNCRNRQELLHCKTPFDEDPSYLSALLYAERDAKALDDVVALAAQRRVNSANDKQEHSRRTREGIKNGTRALGGFLSCIATLLPTVILAVLGIFIASARQWLLGSALGLLPLGLVLLFKRRGKEISLDKVWGWLPGVITFMTYVGCFELYSYGLGGAAAMAAGLCAVGTAIVMFFDGQHEDHDSMLIYVIMTQAGLCLSGVGIGIAIGFDRVLGGLVTGLVIAAALIYATVFFCIMLKDDNLGGFGGVLIWIIMAGATIALFVLCFISRSLAFMAFPPMVVSLISFIICAVFYFGGGNELGDELGGLSIFSAFVCGILAIITTVWCFGVWRANPITDDPNGYRVNRTLSEEVLVIPEGVTVLERVRAPRAEIIVLPDTITRIDDQCFKGCKSLVEIVVPEGVSYLGANAFQNCASLTSATVPGSVNILRAYTFAGCSSLKEVKLGEGITEIEGLCFDGCTALTEIRLPDGMQTVWGNAFSNCYALASISIGANILSLRKKLFLYCDLDVLRVEFRGTEEQWEQVDKHDKWYYGNNSVEMTFLPAG